MARKQQRNRMKVVATTRGRNRMAMGSIRTEPIHDPLLPYTSSMPKDFRLPSTDTVLNYHYGGMINCYRELMRDDQVKACFEQRRNAVTQAQWIVEPGGKTRQDKMAADLLREQLEYLGWDAITDKMLNAIMFGHMVSELIMVRDGRFIMLEDIVIQNPGSFVYDRDCNLRMLTEQNINEGIPVDENYFWRYSVGAPTDREPYGIGLGHWLYWPVQFKKTNQKFRARYNESNASPTVLAKHPDHWVDEGQKEAYAGQISALQTFIQNLRQGASGTVPDSVMIELIQAVRSATPDYDSMHTACNGAISKVILGHSAVADTTPGRLGNEDMANDVRDDITKADADTHDSSFMVGPAKTLTQWNFANAATPRVYRDLAEPEDLNVRAERDSKLFAMNYELTPEMVEQVYGEGYEKKEAAQPDMQTEDDDEDPTEFAEGFSVDADQAELESALDALSDGVLNEQAMEALGPVLDMIEDLGPEEALRRLPEFAPNLESVETTVARLMLVGEVKGRERV